MGMSLLRKKERQKVQEEALSFPKMFLSSFAVGITNPAVILTFLFAFSWMEIGGQAGGIQGIGLVCGVFAGTYLWWGMLTGLTCFLKRKVRNLKIYKINQIFGCILTILGVVIFIRTIL